MKVKYIGTNDKVDSIVGVGLKWTPGQERDVTSTVAEHLLSYPDTWIKTGDETKEEAKEEPVGFKEEDKRPEEPLPVVNFHGMNKDALAKYALEHWNEKFPKNISEDLLRERVTHLHLKHADDKPR